MSVPREGMEIGTPIKDGMSEYIPLINQVQGLYRKLWIKFFYCLMAQACSVCAIKKLGKNEDP
jgi:hypothetical protein